MAAASPIQTNFTSGELSRRMYGRVDLEQYGNGAAALVNAQVLPQGGATKRPGSYFVAKAKNYDSLAILRAFIPSSSAAYVIEFGNGYARFYRDRAQLMAGVSAQELVTPWTTAQLRGLRFAQSIDVMLVFHPEVATRKISRTSSDTFELALAEWIDGPYDTQNTGDIGAGATAPVGSSPETGLGGGSVGGSGSGSGGPATGGGGGEGSEESEGPDGDGGAGVDGGSAGGGGTF